MKCYICNHEMEQKIITINTGWNGYKLIINDVTAYVCPECGEKVLDINEALIIQKLIRNLENKEVQQKTDILSVKEIAARLKVDK